MRNSRTLVLSTITAVLHGSVAKPSSPFWDNMHTKHSWSTLPKNWESLGGPPSGTTLNLYVCLKPERENALIDALYEVSSPKHPKYGIHLSKEEVAELEAPHSETLELVNSWIEHHGIRSSGSSVAMTHGGDTLMVKNLSVAQANTLLNASYQLYRHVESSETIVRTASYALPLALHEHVLTVIPTTSFGSPQTMPRNRSSEAVSRGPATMRSSRDFIDYVSPPFLRWLYDTASYVPTATRQNMLGIVGILGDYPSPTDLTAFMHEYRPDAASASYSVIQVNGGGYDPNNPHVESNLNLQYAEVMAYPTRVIYYSVGRGTSGTDEWFTSWLQYVIIQKVIPQTIVMSYGYYEDNISTEYAAKVCRWFAQLGARGVSVLVTSGNYGVGEGNCVVNGFIRFRPRFPSTCPFVTAVGGTTDFNPEVAASLSGGGFSDIFMREPYQDNAVSTYLQTLGGQYWGFYNPIGRAIPDISAQAMRYNFISSGSVVQKSGTSFAAPVAAGIISLLNDWLISNGGPALGFLNPWLYTSGYLGLLDVTSGTNPGCSTNGFYATVGWDPVTGLGTPGFSTLQQAILLALEQQHGHVGRKES